MIGHETPSPLPFVSLLEKNSPTKKKKDQPKKKRRNKNEQNKIIKIKITKNTQKKEKK